MHEECQWLRAYVEQGSEEAFRKLVQKHAGLVYSVALRRVGGERQLAEDVAQMVFIDVALKARSLLQTKLLAGWLHQHTCYVASHALRSERRRKVREEFAAEMNDHPQNHQHAWKQIAPVLDDLLSRLSTADRNAIILRFFDGQDLRAVGEVLGVSEDTAQKRVARALEKLRSMLARKGFASSVSTATLGSLIASHAVSAAPAQLLTSAASAGLAAANTGTSISLISMLMASTKIKIASALILMAAAGTTLVWQHQNQMEFHKKELNLERQVEELGQENQRLAQMMAKINGENSQQTDSKSKRLFLKDLPAAIQVVLKTPYNEHKDGFKAVVAAVDPVDLPPAAAMLERFPNDEVRRFLRPQFLARWAQTDPQAAMAAASATAKEEHREEARQDVAKAWARTDPNGAVDWAKALPVNESRNKILEGIIATLAETDPQRAAGMALEMPGRFRSDSARDVALAWAHSDPEGAMAWVRTLPVGGPQTSALTAICTTLSTENPSAAADLVGLLPSPLHEPYVGMIAMDWARDDLSSALAWAQGLEGKDQQSALRSVCGEWANADPKAAASFLQKAQPDLLFPIVSTWGATDPGAALEWANQLPDDKARKDMCEAAGLGWAQVAPAAAANFVSGLPAGDLQASVAEAVASRWAENDPAAAAAWAATFPEGHARQVAFQNIILQWGEANPSSAAAWLGTLPAGDSRDTAIVTFADNCLKSYSPSTALTWAQTIRSDGIRNNIIEEIARQWLKSDPVPAQAWIANAAIPENVRANISRN